ncbi:hypothetical protein [Asanoa iriomotensis]|uniref:Uncharacterized protein n=1 Tax=Asanoa iriomotensis TaxID=234613 RepID=A0ABQ4CDU9_9ACTN|nr:hypothetical protein [Asanoa iriomotensis]GIF60952.1 hypothetical protein Air01nite_70470 [Asanoa iriomotensis]
MRLGLSRPARVVRAVAMGLGVRGAVGVAVASLLVVAGAGPAAAADATVFAPNSVPGRTTVVDVWCGARATSASVNVVPFGGPPELPLEPYPAGGPGAFRVTYLIPANAAPGQYALKAECDDGLAGDATLTVGLPAGSDAAEPDGGRTALALVASLAILATLAGAGVAVARRFGPRSRLHT